MNPLSNEERKMYSLEKEFRLLRPFILKQLPCRRCYSEKEIFATEHRLNYKLPSPLKFIYLYMADLLFAWGYLRPLELLHWNCDRLGFFLSEGSGEYIVGTNRNADPNNLYFWEVVDPKDKSYVFEDAFEAAYQRGDERGKKRAAQDYCSYWKQIESDPLLSKEAFSGQSYYSFLDEYALFLSLHTLCKDYEALAQEANRGINKENLHLYLRSNDIKYDAAFLQNLTIKIQQIFIPLSEHTELISSDSPPLLMAYLHTKEHILLVQQLDCPYLTLLTPKKIMSTVLKELEDSIGLSFYPMHCQFD